MESKHTAIGFHSPASGKNDRMRALILGLDGHEISTGLSRCTRITAACYSKPTLHVTTVRRTATGQHKLVVRACGSFLFNERDPIATCKLQDEVARLLKQGPIDRIVLRTGQVRGMYMPHPLAFKVEALLDIAFSHTLLRADNAGVARWARKQVIEFPEPQEPDVSITWRAGQLKAIETAIYAMSGGQVFSGEAEFLR